MDDQSETIAFLSSPAAYGSGAGPVAHHETHGAHVFLAGDRAWKIKRAVRFSYMDLSTLERRRATLLRELEINRPLAPEIYLRVVPVIRRADGGLALGGDGAPVEWALEMRRFADEDLLDARAGAGPLPSDLVKRLADAVVESHRAAPIVAGASGATRVQQVLASLEGPLACAAPHLPGDAVAAFVTACRRRLDGLAGLLDARAKARLVRRCHGDLHLGNLVLWQGRPTLFDALEFDEELATTDVLYDLAFLLMDLEHRGQRPAACLVLNRYLWRTDRAIDLDGLAALPVFLALRSGVRALVKAQHAGQMAAAQGAPEVAEARNYLAAASAYLDPPPPRLIAVGGLSGSGKSTLAAALAPGIGAAPGALHLRSDLERKAMLGVRETDRLPPSAYTPEVAAAVYARLADKARLGLAAGHSVVVDAVFEHAADRDRIAASAASRGVPFTGLWLTAPRETLMARVAARTGDASDADPAVVEAQLRRDPGALGWQAVDASGDAQATAERVQDMLSESP
jgi:aminoglycoside phosphotransferase family enzyme/predicted kinase